MTDRLLVKLVRTSQGGNIDIHPPMCQWLSHGSPLRIQSTDLAGTNPVEVRWAEPPGADPLLVRVSGGPVTVGAVDDLLPSDRWVHFTVHIVADGGTVYCDLYLIAI